MASRVGWVTRVGARVSAFRCIASLSASIVTRFGVGASSSSTRSCRKRRIVGRTPSIAVSVNSLWKRSSCTHVGSIAQLALETGGRRRGEFAVGSRMWFTVSRFAVGCTRTVDVFTSIGRRRCSRGSRRWWKTQTSAWHAWTATIGVHVPLGRMVRDPTSWGGRSSQGLRRW